MSVLEIVELLDESTMKSLLSKSVFSKLFFIDASGNLLQLKSMNIDKKNRVLDIVEFSVSFLTTKLRWFIYYFNSKYTNVIYLLQTFFPSH
jgi:hypothetical protein